ncbi:hypothetical protein IU449_27345 [Nocardia higoensis]|uniref:Uncharacterized protein n=1 Tax=Nocardia higoensis TaxID=228599 RepID=A0ABS0DKZ8_9NOCA|nr:hypothetical protein [Nocardia higoensis]MBF6358217.1 hypothetical protein [Nocardia higoensis]
MKAFHAVASAANLESEWAIQPYREALWCAAFQVDSLDGYFDMAPAESAIRVLTYAIDRFDTHTEELRPLLSPNDFLDLRGNKRVLQGVRKFLLRNGGHISGAIPRDEIQPE